MRILVKLLVISVLLTSCNWKLFSHRTKEKEIHRTDSTHKKENTTRDSSHTVKVEKIDTTITLPGDSVNTIVRRRSFFKYEEKGIEVVYEPDTLDEEKAKIKVKVKPKIVPVVKEVITIEDKVSEKKSLDSVNVKKDDISVKVDSEVRSKMSPPYLLIGIILVVLLIIYRYRKQIWKFLTKVLPL